MTDPIARLTAARFDGPQALFTTAVRLLTERPALPDDLAGLVARLRGEKVFMARDAADAIEALVSENARLSASEPQCAVVKPLKWVRSDYSSRSECGNYHGLHCESGFWASMGAREITSTSETREEFEAAAQADQEARILSAITARPETDLRAEGWAAAIEAAAGIDIFFPPPDAEWSDDQCDAAEIAVNEYCDRIRALTPPADISAALERINWPHGE